MGNWDLAQLFSETDCRTLDADGEIQSILFRNEPYRGAPSEVFAYVGVPESTRKPVPGMVCVHGGGGRAFKEWVEMWVDRGYAAIAMDLSGRDAQGKRLPNGGPEQDHAAKFDPSVSWEDLWTYHAVAAVIRSHTLLRSLPAVDPGRVGVTGISWGGYLTCILAGVDTRFGCAVPVYGCGFLQHNGAEDWMKIFQEMTPEQRQRWHEKCDPSVYLRDASLPMLFVSGTNDFAYPLDSLQKSHALPGGPVSLCVRFEMAHSHEAGWSPREIGLFADSHLRGGPPLPQIGATMREGARVAANFASDRPVERGYVLHTRDGGTWQARKWRLSFACVEAGRVHAELPGGTTAHFLAIEDDRGAYVSSPLEEGGA
jgi:dienelactone hydrolase